MPLFKTTKEDGTCAQGWPHKVGYPICETAKSQQVTTTTPDYFVYCCPPAPVEMEGVSGINKRSNFRENVPRPKGVHSYYNMMWDPRVRRGDVRHLNAKREEEECEKIRQFLRKPRKGKTYAELKAEKKERLHNLITSQPEKDSVRFSNLQISTLIPKNTEKYLIDLSDEIDVADPCYKGRRLQTLRTFPVAPSKHPNAVDIATQIYPGEFFDFEGDSQPVIERLLGAVLEQAHFEILEEEELEALRLQRDNAEKSRLDSKKMIEKMIERERRIAKERNRLEKGDTDEQMSESKRFYNICTFAGSMTKKAISDCISNLKKEKYIVSESTAVLEREFITLLDDEVNQEIKMRMASRRLLDEVIMDVVNKREGEYAEAIWREVYEEDPLKLLNDDGLVPPPTPGTSYMEGETDEDEMGSGGLINEVPSDY